MASNEKGKHGLVPAVSARGKHNIETFRNMVLKAVDCIYKTENKMSSFKMVSDYIDRCFKVRNDFVVRHTLRNLVGMNILRKKGSLYGVQKLEWSPGTKIKQSSKRKSKYGKRNYSKKQNKRRKPRYKIKSSSTRKQGKRRKQKISGKRRRSSRKKQTKRKPIC